LNSFSIWWLAIRPKTLTISITPVLLGSALAWHDHTSFSSLTFLVILFSALAIQIGTNLYNDAADFEKGADTTERLGPKRAAQQGWLTAKQIKTGALFSFIMAFIAGIYLVWLGGTGIVILGLISIFCGYAYTAGPKPIAYSPFGELFVLIFFGFCAVGGTYYLQSQQLNLITLFIASGIGSMAAAILLINNYRDLSGDEKASKLTLVHYTGHPAARLIYAFMVIYPYLILFSLVLYPLALSSPAYSWFILLPLFSFPLAVKAIRLLLTLEISSKLNLVLVKTAQLQLIYTILLCSALFIERVH